MKITPNKWVMRALLASATAMVIIGIYGALSLGMRADWIAFYTAGNFLLDGSASQLYQAEIVQAWQAPLIGNFIARFLYAPAFAIMYIPIAIFPPSLARLAWLLIGMLAALLAASLSTRWSRLSIPVSMLALLAFPPLALSLAVGQNSSITLLIFTVVASLEFRGRHDYLPGLIAGLALYKPQLLLPLVAFWLGGQRWRSFIGLFGSAILVGILSMLVSPPASLAYLNYTSQFFDLAENTTNTGANISFFAMSQIMGIAIAGGVSLIIFILGRRDKIRIIYAMFWLAPILVTPYIVIYDMVLLILPISFLIPLLAHDRMLQVGVGLVWLSVLFAPVVMSTRPVTFSALILFIFCMYRFLKPRNQDNFAEISQSEGFAK